MLLKYIQTYFSIYNSKHRIIVNVNVNVNENEINETIDIHVAQWTDNNTDANCEFLLSKDYCIVKALLWKRKWETSNQKAWLP